MTTKKPTPGEAVKRWAKENPTSVGRVKVISLTPAGRGGWRGLKQKVTTFYVTGGKAALTKSPRGGGFNGICQVCGCVYLEPELKHAWKLDPEAGQVLSEVPFEYLGHKLTRRRGKFGRLVACLNCIKADELTAEWKGGADIDWDTLTCYEHREHPVLCRKDQGQNSLLTTLDIRDEQRENLQ